MLRLLQRAFVAAALAVLPFGGAHAALSHAAFAFSGSGGFATRLEVTTNTGVYVLDATDRGWVLMDGTNNGHPPDNNYIVGLCGSSDSCGADDVVHRNWFAFDLDTTAFSSISAARLLLDVPDPAGIDQGVYVGQGDPVYTLHEVTSLAGQFVFGLAGLAEFADLGDGPAFGSRTYTLADQGTTTAIVLNAAGVAYLNTRFGNLAILGGNVNRELPPAPPIPASTPGTLALLTLLLLAAAWAAQRGGRPRAG